ncbi:MULTISPECIES: hypothetical protein [unclassified Crossiella]|uniref:hypothetical protein n=1 Tax=unclassified Crossiella TaxID=2620835 RepID=UPI001FFEDB55|nr:MULTISPECIES: hypothetical protein [unclassified Crossiella]MCK2237954.1 hypothetical protein [Crossiella sp. S99.2]MCK2255237.1 hypothetical protein [Crossiella sp. S99.1]
MSEFIVLGIGAFGGIALLAIALIRRGARPAASPAGGPANDRPQSKTEAELGGYREYFGGP